MRYSFHIVNTICGNYISHEKVKWGGFKYFIYSCFNDLVVEIVMYEVTFVVVQPILGELSFILQYKRT